MNTKISVQIDIDRKNSFEVFKRDRFTSQYRRRKAPEVILHVGRTNTEIQECTAVHARSWHTMDNLSGL
jgi:hypothetical protein